MGPRPSIPALMCFAASPYRFPYSFFFLKCSGSHLLSHAVSSRVPSAAWVLTIVFGMGTGVSPKRIATGTFFVYLSFVPPALSSSPLRFLSLASGFLCSLDRAHRKASKLSFLFPRPILRTNALINE